MSGALLLALLGAPRPVAAQPPPADTFADVAPIFFAHCAGCHRPGGIGPFSLLTYDDIAPRAGQIAAAVSHRTMPPWKPERGHGEFLNERRLPEPELARLVRWLDAGAPAGNLAGTPLAPRFPDGWQRGEPDLVIAMPEPFELPASGPDVFRNFVLPIPTTERRYVRAWEFRPGNGSAVHHATIGLDPERSSRVLDTRDPAPGYAGITPFSVVNPDGYFLGWSPGQRQPQEAVAGMAWTLPPGADLMFSMHLRPTGRSERVQASIGLYFTDEAPGNSPLSLRLGRQDIDIPAGDAQYTIANEYRLPVDVELHSVYPHAHHLAREMRAWAVRPDGAEVPLLRISDWDFNWQDVYRYREPLHLTAGTVVHMEFRYDNSGHRHHGGGAPRRVTFGPNSSDEMGDLWLQVVAANARERAALERDFERKLLPETIAGVEMMVRLDPENAALHDEAGLLHQQAGAHDRAVDHFAQSLRLRPSSAARNNLASAYLALGRHREARPLLVRALADDPAYALARYNFGLLLQLEGRVADAVEQYRAAITLQPGHGESHFMLGSALAARGEVPGATAAYRAAIRLRPNWILPMLELAWLLATSPEADAGERWEARRLAEQAARVAEPTSAAGMDVLAATLAATGDFQQASTAAAQALAAARAAGQDALAEQIERRLRLYVAQQPFMQP